MTLEVLKHLKTEDMVEVDSPGFRYTVSKNPFNPGAVRRIIRSAILLCSYVSPSRANNSQKLLCRITIELMVLLLVTVQDGGRIFSALMLKKRDDQQ